MRTDNASFTSIHSYFAWDHARLDGLLADLDRTIEHGDPRHAERAFGHFERGMRRHLRIEEEVLFQLYAFDRTGAAKGPTQTIQSEHARILLHVDEMGRALGAQDVATFRAAYAKLVAILTEHNAKEERVLYPLVDSLLGAIEAERLVTRLRAG